MVQEVSLMQLSSFTKMNAIKSSLKLQVVFLTMPQPSAVGVQNWSCCLGGSSGIMSLPCQLLNCGHL